MCLDASDSKFLYLLLVSAAFLTFGSYFCFDLPAVLQNAIEDSDPAITPLRFNLFYSAYSITNSVCVLVGGWMIDKFGTRISALVTTILILLGQVLWSLGAAVGGNLGYGLMCLGRVFFGSGAGSTSVVQSCIVAHYFKEKALSLAFTLGLTLSRLASVLNFIVTPILLQKTDSWVFCSWFGTLLALISVASAVGFAMLDHAYGFAQTEHPRATQPQKIKISRAVSLSDIKSFPLSYWITCCCCMFFYMGLYGFIANAPFYFENAFHLSGPVSSGYSSLAYVVSLLLLPLCGRIVDVIGRQSILMIAGFILSILAYAMVIDLAISPVACMILLGVTYSLESAVLWPVVPFLLELNQTGKGVGIMLSLQMLGFSLSSFAIGKLATDFSFRLGSIPFIILCQAAGLLLSVILLLWDIHTGGPLTKSPRESRAIASLARSRPIPSSHGGSTTSFSRRTTHPLHLSNLTSDSGGVTLESHTGNPIFDFADTEASTSSESEADAFLSVRYYSIH